MANGFLSIIVENASEVAAYGEETYNSEVYESRKGKLRSRNSFGYDDVPLNPELGEVSEA